MKKHKKKNSMLPTLLSVSLLGLVILLGTYFLPSLVSSTSSLNYSTYLAGSGEDSARDVFVDSLGNTYVAGGTKSTNFKTTVGAYDVTHNGNMDAFVMKFAPDGTLLWSTFFGGPNYERAYGLEVDNQGFVYIGGRAGPGIPTTPGVVQSNFGGDVAPGVAYGPQDPFVAKLSPDGKQLIWATYFGSDGGEVARDIAVDDFGNVYLALTGTDRLNPFIFPGSNVPGFQKVHQAGDDGAIAKISSDGTQLVYASYIGGSGNELEGPTVRVDSSGNAYIIGTTNSTDILTTPGAFQPTYGGGNFDYVYIKVSPDGGTVLASTYFGGNKEESSETHSLWVDQYGVVYIAAQTGSTNLPFSGTFQTTNAGNFDGYIAKISTDGQQLLAGTYIGGTLGDLLEGVAVDIAGNVYVGGRTVSTNFPITSDAVQKTKAAKNDVWFAKMSPDLKTLLYGSYLGGNNDDEGRSLAIDSQGNIYSIGRTKSTNFPTTANALKRTASTPIDSYFSKIILSTVVPPPPPPPDTIFPTVSMTAPADGSMVSSSTVVSANASDDVGVFGVQFKLDGINLGLEDTTSPYSINWNTTQTTNGNHVLTAVARDAANNQTSSAGVSVTVNNIALPPPPPPPPPSTSTKPVASYELDEGGGLTSADLSGNSIIASLVNGTAWSASGHLNNALFFDGLNDYASLNTTSLLNNLSSFTLAAWINPSAYNNASNVPGEFFDKGDSKKRFMFELNGQISGQVRFSTTDAKTITSQVIPLNQWSHVVMTFSSLDKKIRIYINGVESSYSQQTAGVGTIQADGVISPTGWSIGSRAGNIHFYSGLIDQIRIYKVALSSAEANQLYNQ